MASQILESFERYTAWLSVDHVDDDPVRLWSHAAAALIPGVEKLQSLLEAVDPDLIDETVDQLMTTVKTYPGNVLFILDDVHELKNKKTLVSLSRLITLPPSNLTIMLTTRSNLELPVGRLRAHGHLVDVRTEDLAFTKP